jgi:hypothetical protein
MAPAATIARAMCGRADHAVTGDRRHPLPGDVDAEFAQLAHHVPGAAQAVRGDGVQLLRQPGVRGVNVVGEQVHAVAVEAAGQFHAGHQGQAGREGPAGLGMPGQRVVVGERDHVQARGAGSGASPRRADRSRPRRCCANADRCGERSS